MTTLTVPSTPSLSAPSPVPGRSGWGNLIMRRFSVNEYHRMIELGILGEDDPIELLDGWLVQKMSRNPPHDNSILKTLKRLSRLVPAGWEVRVQSALTLADSEPEPDFAVVRGDESTFGARHPGPSEVGLLIEVADSTLARDRDEKARIYANAGIAVYWIINLIDRQVEIHTVPSGPTAAPGYASRQIFGANDAMPLALDGVAIGSLAVSELLP